MRTRSTLRIAGPVVMALAIAAGLRLGSALEKPAAEEKAEKRLDVRVFGHSEIHSGSKATLRVVTADFKTEAPIRGAEVEISLLNAKTNKLWPLLKGTTNALGTLDASFRIPELPDGKFEFRIDAKSGDEEGEVRYPIKLKDAFSIYLTTDKPIYQPSQDMHVRALVLRKSDMKPLAGETGLIEIEDPKGNKVFKKSGRFSQFGITSTKFTLADEINTGHYTIRVEAGGARAEKKVTVDRYVLPKFKIQCKLDKDFYFPKERVEGKLDAEYFFGKPVSGAKVEVKASTFDVAFRQFAVWQGRTDEGGACAFDVQLPEHFVGQPVTQGKGLVKFDIKVTDTADHAEKKTVNTTVSEGSLVVHAFPEGGRVVSGLENTVFVATTYPDGSPAQCSVTCKLVPPSPGEAGESKDSTVRLETGELGIAELRFQPDRPRLGKGKYKLQVTAADDRGNSAEKTFDLSVEPTEVGLLIRPDQPLYKVGEEMTLTVLSTKPDSAVYIDIVKGQQTVLTRSHELSGGSSTLSIDLSPDLFGLLEIHAYQIRKSLSIIRDAKRVFVQRADDLSIEIVLDKTQYLPAEKAVLDFQVKDAGGHPVLAALGLYVVDEAVFGRSELQPGLEKVFFLLEKEIMTPQYQIRGVTSDILLGAFPRDVNVAARKSQAARVLFSAVQPPARIPVARSSREEEMRQVLVEAQKKIWKAIQDRAKKSGWVARNLGPLVQDGYLRADDLLDPWGTPYDRSGCTCDSCRKRQLVLWSLGPDGKKNTADDVYVSAGGVVDRRLQERNIVLLEAGFAGRGGEEARRLEPEAAPQAAAAGIAVAKKAKGRGVGKPPARVREFFPETLFVEPQLITDENGRARQEVNLADSITKWRLSAFASSPIGALGSTTRPIRVFQDFFVDIDFPVALTQNDQVSVPVAIYNYLEKPQQVRLVAERGSWFELIDGAEKVVNLEPSQVTAVYFPIRVKELGQRKFTVKAYGTELGDAIRREVEVVPDGKRFESVVNGRLLERTEHVLSVPQESIEDSYKILVKFYPGVVCQLLEGMEGLLRLPGG